MAQLDLKNCDIYLVDGYTGSALVNDATPPTTGNTITIDGHSGIIPAGATFTFNGETIVHTVVSVVGGATPTELTFTPAISADETLADNGPITFGGIQLQINISDGNMTYSEKRTIEYKKDRGRLDVTREGDEEPIDVSLDIRWDFIASISGAAVPTPEEFLKQEGPASSYTSSSDDVCEPYAVDLYIVHTPPCTGVQRETVLLKDFRYEQINHDYKAGMLQATGKCNTTRAIKARVAA